jgi:hypothetical protein
MHRLSDLLEHVDELVGILWPVGWILVERPEDDLLELWWD